MQLLMLQDPLKNCTVRRKQAHVDVAGSTNALELHGVLAQGSFIQRADLRLGEEEGNLPAWVRDATWLETALELLKKVD